ncbi:Protein of unknown function [Gryllus bimaculatus]|nr:Protein of unknown function [Gryllus bimaculatus]
MYRMAFRLWLLPTFLFHVGQIFTFLWDNYTFSVGTALHQPNLRYIMMLSGGVSLSRYVGEDAFGLQLDFGWNNHGWKGAYEYSSRIMQRMIFRLPELFTHVHKWGKLLESLTTLTPYGRKKYACRKATLRIAPKAEDEWESWARAPRSSRGVFADALAMDLRLQAAHAARQRRALAHDVSLPIIVHAQCL